MNTERTPQTYLEVPGPCCSIMKILVNPVAPTYQFHDQLMAAKTKAQVIDILCHRASQHGWFADSPEGLYDKLQGFRSSPQRQ